MRAFLKKYWITILIYAGMVYAYIYIAGHKIFLSLIHI